MNIDLVYLTEICNPKQWKTIQKSSFSDSGYPVYGANGKIGFYSEFNHEHPTLMITCRGATCGSINISESKSYITGNAMALDALDENRISLKYLYYVLKKTDFSSIITGVAQPQITRQSLERLQIPLPPLPEQKRIAAILDAADALRTQRRQSIAELDLLLQSTFLEMFGDPVENPKGWGIQSLERLIDPNRPITYGILKPGDDIEDGIPYIRVVDIKNEKVLTDQLKKTTKKIASQYKRSQLKFGDLLMSIRGHVGRMAIVPINAEGANITQDTARLALTDADAAFVMQCLTTEGMKNYMARRTKGIAVQGINLGDVKQLPIIMPPLKLQKEFSTIVDAIVMQKNRLQAHLVELDTLFASLQQRAFNGEL